MTHPSANSPFSPVPAEASWAEKSSAGEPSALSRSATTVAGYSCSARMMESLTHFPSGTTSQPSTGVPGLDAWISSLEDSPARTSAPQEKAQASTENAQDSGQKWPALLARFDPATSSWKTAQCSLFEDSAPSLATWPRWGSMRNGVVYQRQKPAHLTSESVSGSWRTPTLWMLNADRAKDPKYAHRKVTKGPTITLADQVKWPTIRSSHADRGGRGDLIQAIRGNPNSHYRMWQTPTVQDANGRDRHNQRDGSVTLSLLGQARMWPTATATQHKDWSPNHNRANTDDDRLDYTVERAASQHGQQILPMRLNPDWVEWLMGWVIGWTDLKPLAMAKFREWWQQHGLCCDDSVRSDTNG